MNSSVSAQDNLSTRVQVLDAKNEEKRRTSSCYWFSPSQSTHQTRFTDWGETTVEFGRYRLDVSSCLRNFSSQFREHKKKSDSHMKPTEAIPVLATSNPTPPPPPPPEVGVKSSRLSFASLAFKPPNQSENREVTSNRQCQLESEEYWRRSCLPKWWEVALFFWVLACFSSKGGNESVTSEQSRN